MKNSLTIQDFDDVPPFVLALLDEAGNRTRYRNKVGNLGIVCKQDKNLPLFSKGQVNPPDEEGEIVVEDIAVDSEMSSLSLSASEAMKCLPEKGQVFFMHLDLVNFRQELKHKSKRRGSRIRKKVLLSISAPIRILPSTYPKTLEILIGGTPWEANTERTALAGSEISDLSLVFRDGSGKEVSDYTSLT